MSKYSLIIVESDLKHLSELSNYFTSSDSFAVLDTSVNGQDALDSIKRHLPDFAIINTFLPNGDGFYILEELLKCNCKTKVFIISSLNKESYAIKSMSLGAEYFMLKPFDIGFLASQMLECVKQVSSPVHNILSSNTQIKSRASKSVEEKISNVFIQIGIPAHIRGYQYLREGIKLAIDDPFIINHITKKLYPSIADKFNTSSSKVERAIRHAIEVAWNRGKVEYLNNLFGIKVCSKNQKPTNGEFVALIADKLLLDGAC